MLLSKYILDKKNGANNTIVLLRENYDELSEKYNKLEAENKELREQISTLMATINILEKSLDDCRNK